MFLGTGSDVGKSIIAAGFCRILLRRGYRVAPFKAQNMALNSFVTMDGKEMGRAQVMQALAAGLLPDADMNPVLLKPMGQAMTQVVLQGKVFRNESAKGYYQMKDLLLPRVMESYGRLKERYDAIVLEGAGSASEINLRERDIVNTEMAKRAGSPVILVADIDRGGVFASMIGTMNLFTRRERRLVMGSIVNKFRGDVTLFSSGVEILERKTRRPVFGVLPYFTDLHLPEEDSVALQHGRKGRGGVVDGVRISVVHLPYISNYTDFDPFEVEEGVELRYTKIPLELQNSDVVILPGTKNTIADLQWLKENGFEEALKKHVRRGKTLIGICGGFQMLGTSVQDPHGVETDHGETTGLGLLEMGTVLEREKTLARVEGSCIPESIIGIASGSVSVEGYEIHMGVSEGNACGNPVFQLNSRNGAPIDQTEGACNKNGTVWGTYLHGLFENDRFRSGFLRKHGRAVGKELNYRTFLDGQYDRLADLIEEHVRVDAILHTAERFRR
jgi:adenosylcobyric acid synthase